MFCGKFKSYRTFRENHIWASLNQLLQQKKREQDHLSYQNYLKTIQEAITNGNQKLTDSSLSSDEKKKSNRRIKKLKKRKCLL